MRVHRQDVDDRPAFAPLPHRPDRRLHQEERRAGVDVEQLRPDVEIGIEERGAVGQPGRIDEEVDPPEAVEALADDPRRRVGRGEVGGEKMRVGAERPDPRGNLGAAGRIPPGQKDSGDARTCRGLGDCRADALGRTGDKYDLAVEASLHASLLPMERSFYLLEYGMNVRRESIGRFVWRWVPCPSRMTAWALRC